MPNNVDRPRHGPFTTWQWAVIFSYFCIVVSSITTYTLSNNATDAALNANRARAKSDRTEQLAKNNKQILDKQDAETRARIEQFCDLVNARQRDLEIRLRQTKIYVKSSDGRENTGINRAIRTVTLPQLKRDVRSGHKQIPDVCRKKR